MRVHKLFFLLLCGCGLTLFGQDSCPAPTSAPTPTKTQTPTVPEGDQHPGSCKTVTTEKKGETQELYLKGTCPPDEKGYTVNFEEIAAIELIQFISQISNTNYVFNSEDLQFSVTIISKEPTTAEDLSAAMLQILKMHGLSVIEQGNNILVYKNQSLSKLSTVITDENVDKSCDSAIITRVFKLYNIEPSKVSAIVKPLLSSDAIVEVSTETRHLIISDITANVEKIADLLNALDTPNASFEVSEYHVQSAYPEALVAYAKEILAPMIQDNPMQMIAQPSAKKIFIVSTPYLNAKACQVLSALDTSEVTDVMDLPSSAMANNTFKVYKLRYFEGGAIQTAIQKIAANLGQAGVANLDMVNTINSIQYMKDSNSLVMTGTPQAIDKVFALLRELDAVPKQVYIEVLIIDTTLTNSLDFGVEWIALGDEQDKLAYASGLLGSTSSLQANARTVASTPNSTTGNPPAVPNPGTDVPLPTGGSQTQAFGFGIVGNILRHNGESFLTLGALVSALDTESETKIVLNPKIMTRDATTAQMFVGSNIPFQTTSTVVQQTGSVTQNIQYQDIGVDLTVKPIISPGNIVTLDICQTIQQNVSGQGNLTPTTSKKTTNTIVHVPNNCFLVMSGQVSDTVNNVRSGIPCLGTLPLIGPAFSRNIESRSKTNLIMFIRPKVITTTQEGLDLSNQEGYDYNFDTHPCSLIECGQELAPECEVYPAPRCPSN